MKYLNCSICGVEKTTNKTQLSERCKQCTNKNRPSKLKGTKLSEARKDLNRGPREEWTKEKRIAHSLRQGGDGNLERDERGLRKWSIAIRKRDGACIDCGSVKLLEAHHLVGKAKFPEVSTELWNGITLCRKCHVAEHKIVGYK